MASVLESLTQQLGGSTLKQISGLLGSDQKTTGTAMAAALPTIMSALSRNASSQQGAESLTNALAKDHDGGIMDNLSGFLQQASSGPGDGILKHVLGGRRQTVESGLSKTSGMDATQVGQLMTMLAPVVMGALGKAQRQQHMDASGVSNLLNQEQEVAKRTAPTEMGLVGSLLDADGDGDVDISDVARKGFGILGKLFDR